MMFQTPYILQRTYLLKRNGLPYTKPPWGTLAAVNLKTGTLQFEVPLGTISAASVVVTIPLIALVLINANNNFPFGGTSILIMVGVALDTVKQIESQLQQRNYEGFLR